MQAERDWLRYRVETPCQSRRQREQKLVVSGLGIEEPEKGLYGREGVGS